jgi:hypothetical protein
MIAMEGSCDARWSLSLRLGLVCCCLISALFGAKFRLGFAFRGYTPGCFVKSGEVVWNVEVADWRNSSVWKVLIWKELRVYEKKEVGGIWAEGRVMLQGSIDLHTCQ